MWAFSLACRSHFSAFIPPDPPLPGDCVARKEKGRHSLRKRESKEFEKEYLIRNHTIFFMTEPAWMPACAGPVPCWCRAGMTNCDTVSWGRVRGLNLTIEKNPFFVAIFLLFNNI